jgi:alanine racemase
MSGRPELAHMRPTWAEIDLRAFDRNVAAILSHLPPGAKLVTVMKANAYGHGAVQLAQRLVANTHDPRVVMIAVILLEEALQLRRAGITLPILVLGPMQPEQLPAALEHGLTIGVPGPEELASVCAMRVAGGVEIHLKLDSGMGRMGVTEHELPAVIDLLRNAPHVKVAALYTHFANASDRTDPFTEQQLARFNAMAATLREAGVDAPLHHVANSSGMIRGSVSPGELARAGIWLYGGEPMDHEQARLEPLMRWRTQIARLKELPEGHNVGYGMTFRTARPSRIATLPVGYADGYQRRLSNSGEVLVRGRRAPVVGRVSMDLITIDVTDIADAAVGEEVVLMGRQGGDEISGEEIAAKLGTISYEVFCGVGARVPRVYLDGDRIVSVTTRFDR